ncbi:hypothetical protein AN218_12565, partial [Streptomyces nanshensis]
MLRARGRHPAQRRRTPLRRPLGLQRGGGLAQSEQPGDRLPVERGDRAAERQMVGELRAVQVVALPVPGQQAAG